jgi:hypothetical protein
MHKDELLQLHSLLCQMKRFFDENGMDTEGGFQEYDELQVSPQHIHKSKTDHKKAVFLLGKGLTDVAVATSPQVRSRMRDRFLRLAANATEDDGGPQPASEPKPRTEHLPAFALAALSN